MRKGEFYGRHTPGSQCFLIEVINDPLDGKVNVIWRNVDSEAPCPNRWCDGGESCGSQPRMLTVDADYAQQISLVKLTNEEVWERIVNMVSVKTCGRPKPVYSPPVFIP